MGMQLAVSMAVYSVEKLVMPRVVRKVDLMACHLVDLKVELLVAQTGEYLVGSLVE